MTRQARLDVDRLNRLGMIEAIWGEHKTCEQIAEILNSLEKSNQLALVTRVSEDKANKLLGSFSHAEFHRHARCLTLGKSLKTFNSPKNQVAVVSGGTSDFPVAAEAELALQLHGSNVDTLLDVGVAGLHRVLDKLERLKKSKVIIACAGMEGSLPTVLAGLVPQPVIGVPVSIGYGISECGTTALNSMLASCSPGLTVVNIDNGYGAAMAALRIINADSSKGMVKSEEYQ